MSSLACFVSPRNAARLGLRTAAHRQSTGPELLERPISSGLVCGRLSVGLREKRGSDSALVDDPQFRLLDDPNDLVRAKNYYSIPGSSERYPRDAVINHRSYGEGKLAPGDTIEGYLLGYGYLPIPREIRRGSNIPMKLSVLTAKVSVTRLC